MQKAIIFLSIIEFALIIYLLSRKRTAHLEDKGSTSKAIGNDNNGSIKKAEQDLTDVRNTLQQKEKEIKQLNDNIEDLEDEIDDQNKKYREEKKTLNTEIDTYKVKLEQTQSKLTEQCTLNKKQDEIIALKKDALGLVGHLLVAKPQKDSDVSEQKIQNIDSLSEFILEEFKAFFDENRSQKIKNSEEWKFLFDEGFSEWKCSAKKQWLDNKTSIAFAGEFSAGKTSIVNKILSMNNSGNALQLPVSTKATTAVPTYISSGIGDSYRFYTPDNQLKCLDRSAFEMVSKEVLDELSGISNLIKYFVMTCKNLPFKNMSILDTPGFASNDKEDSLRTIEVINECDALFWVVDANTGTVNKTSLETIRKHLKKPLYVIINKTDTKSPDELPKLEKQIKADFEKSKIKVEKILFYNDKGKHNAKIEDIVKVINSVRQTNCSSKYLERLKEFAENIYSSCKKDTDNLEKIVKNSRQNVMQCYDNFINKLNSLQKDIDDVYRIPKFETWKVWRWYEVYEIPKEKAVVFYQILENIRGNTTPELDVACRKTLDADEHYCHDVEVYARQKNDLDRYEKLLKNLRQKIQRII